jgi:deoxyribonucleoside regulator
MSQNNHRKVSKKKRRQLIKIAKLYYRYNYTQGEIAKRLGLSRVKVHRLLKTAEDIGVVKINIEPGNVDYFEVEDQLIHQFNLRDALVVPAPEEKTGLYMALAKGATEWLKPRLKSGTRVGLGLGRTISHLPLAFEVDRQIDCVFTEVVGAASDHNQGFASYNITSRMAEIVGGKAEFFYAPTFVSRPELKQDLTAEPSIKRALARARKCEYVLQSVGTVDKNSLVYLHDQISEIELEELKNLGAVGDALGHYYDEHGQEVEAEINQLVIGLDLEDIKKIEWSVLIAGGAEKIPAVRGALRNHLFNVLITDHQTATTLCAESEHEAG